MKRVIGFMMCQMILMAAHPTKKGYEIDDTATDFKLKNVDGHVVSLSDYKDAHGFIIIFDCNTCPYSKAYNQRVIALNDKYFSKGVPVIAINANDGGGDSFDDKVRIAKNKNYKFPYLFDETQQVAKTYCATNTPHVFVLIKELTVSYIGTNDDNPHDDDAVSKAFC